MKKILFNSNKVSESLLNTLHIEIKRLIDVDEDILNKVSNWMYEWWGKDNNLVFEAVKCFMKYSMQKDKLPMTFGLFLNENLIGIYQLVYFDLTIRPDIYPLLDNVYIDKNYRNKGYSKILLESVEQNARKYLNFDEIFLYTKHVGLYESFGWTFVSNIDTYQKKIEFKDYINLN